MKKFNLLIPIAGKGSRFPREEFFLPKPLILIDDKTIIEWTMDSIDYSDCNLIFIVREEHVLEFSIDSFLRSKFGNDIQIISTEKVTDGSVCSCRLAEHLIDNDLPLIIHCSDIFCEPKLNPVEIDKDVDGFILTFKSNNPNYSYSELDSDNLVTRVAEKQVISNQASVGLYYFKTGHLFIKYSDQMIIQNLRTNNEFFIAPLYNLLISDGLKVTTKEVEKMHIFGTPDEYNFFTKQSLRTWPQNKKVIGLCSDHSGFEAKELFKTILQERNIKYIDFGCFNKKDCDYSEFVKLTCKSIIEKKCDFGVGFCRTGQGVNMTANKIYGIRAALCYNEYITEYAVKHSCANFFSFSEKFNNIETFKIHLNKILNNTFDGGRHQNRISKLEKFI